MRKVRTYSSDIDLIKEKRAHIVKTAVELIVKKGYNRTNTRELAAALGMSTGGLYHWIGSKDDILYLIVNFTSDLTQGLLDNCTRCNGTCITEHLKESIKIYFFGVEEFRNFHNFINHVMLSLSVNDRRIVYENESRIVGYFEKLLEEGVRRGEFRQVDCKCIAHNIVAIANAWANRGWYLKKYYTIERYTKEETENLLGQLQASPVAGTCSL